MKKIWTYIKAFFNRIKLWLIPVGVLLITGFIVFQKFLMSDKEFEKKADEHKDKADAIKKETIKKIEVIDQELLGIKKEQDAIKQNIKDREKKENKFFKFLGE
jgi:hypothetical protein